MANHFEASLIENERKIRRDNSKNYTILSLNKQFGQSHLNKTANDLQFVEKTNKNADELYR